MERKSQHRLCELVQTKTVALNISPVLRIKINYLQDEQVLNAAWNKLNMNFNCPLNDAIEPAWPHEW